MNRALQMLWARFTKRHCLCLVILMQVSLPGNRGHAGETILKEVMNGGFEEWTDAGPKGWVLNEHIDLAGSWEASTSARTGKRALMLHSGARKQCHAYQRFYPVSPATFFRVTAWVKGEGEVRLLVYAYDQRLQFNGSWQAPSILLQENYQPVRMCYVPCKPDVGFVALVLACAGKEAFAIFDDVVAETVSTEELERTTGYVSDLAAEVGSGQWRAPERGSLDLSEGPYVQPALRTTFGIAKESDPSFDVSTWWHQSGGGGAGGITWASADGPRFPLAGAISL